MLRITIEKVPYGIEEGSHIMYQGTITNDGTGTLSRGNYRISLGTKGGKTVYKTGYVRGFPRKKNIAWKLLLDGLKSCLPGKPRGEDAMAILLGRSGFDDWWYGVDEDIRMDIMNELNEALE